MPEPDLIQVTVLYFRCRRCLADIESRPGMAFASLAGRGRRGEVPLDGVPYWPRTRDELRVLAAGNLLPITRHACGQVPMSEAVDGIVESRAGVVDFVGYNWMEHK
jgi:hypothetical protein